MKSWIISIIEAIVRAIFRKSPEERRAEKTDKALAEWEKEHKRLEADRDKTKNAFEAFLAGSGGSSDSFFRLRDDYQQAAKALGACRARQPPNLPS